ncbi:MAG: thiol reductant ABC exporter subunit CydD [Aquisalimonadaceae bacterium]
MVTTDQRWLAVQAGPVRGLLVVASLAGLFAAWITIAQAGFLAAIVHGLLVDDLQRQQLLLWFSLLLAGIPLRSLCIAAKDYAGLRAALQVRGVVRKNLADHLMTLGPVGLAAVGTGRATSTLLEQVDALEGYYARFLPQMRLAILIPLSVLAVVFWLDWLAALLLLFAAPLIPLFMALVGMGAASVHRGQFLALERLSAFFLDRLQGLETLRHLGRGEDTIHALATNADHYRRRTMAVLRVAFLSSAVLEFFSSVAIAMTAIYIGLGLLGYLTLGPAEQLTLFSGLFILLLAPEVFAPLRELAQHYHDRAAALGAAAGIRELLGTPSPAVPRHGRAHPSGKAPTITLTAVTAGYGADTAPALQDIFITFPAGRTTLITGPSGSGKSTLLLLILGMLDHRQGEVLVDGRPLRDLAAGSLEATIGWLGQTPRLLPGTVADNIRLGRPTASAEDVETAAANAGVLRFTDALPDGLDTPLGERGSGISGGEAQRVALARVLLRDPPLLVLDEPTASLDPESRRILLDALERQCRDRTLIIATHQPAQMPWADHHVELKGGRIRGTGDG